MNTHSGSSPDVERQSPHGSLAFLEVLQVEELIALALNYLFKDVFYMEHSRKIEVVFFQNKGKCVYHTVIMKIWALSRVKIK